MEAASFLAFAALVAVLVCPTFSPADTTDMSGTVNGGDIAAGDEWDVQSGSSLTNQSGGRLTNQGTLTIFENAALNNQAGSTLTNFNLVTNGLGATLNNSGTISTTGQSIITNAGLLNNNDHATFETSYIFRNTGSATFNNFGSLSNTASFHNSGIINSSGTFQNSSSGTISNDGTMNISSSLTNNGFFNNTGGTINLDHSLENNSGSTFNNQGIINFHNGSQFDNYSLFNNNFDATLNNRGVLANYVSSTILNNGSIQNNGTIDNNGILNNAQGTLDNRGIIRNEYRSQLYNSGLLTNGSDGIIENKSLLNNEGTLTNQATAVLNNYGTLNNSGGTLNNSGSFTNEANGVVYSGIFNNEESGTLTNIGNLSNTSIFTNNNGGTVDNKGILLNATGKILHNHGTLNNSGSLENQGSIDNASGTLSIQSGGVYTGNAQSTLSRGTLNVLNGGKLAVAGGDNVTVEDLYLSSGGTYVLLFSNSGVVTLHGQVHLLSNTDEQSTAPTLTTITDAPLYTATLTATAGASSATITSTAKSFGSVMGSAAAGLDTVRAIAASDSAVAGFFDALCGSNNLGQVQTAVRQAMGEGAVNSANLVLGTAHVFNGAVSLQLGSFSSGARPTTLAAGFWSTAGQAQGLPDDDSGLMVTLAQIASMNGVQNNVQDAQNGLSSLGMRGQAQWMHQGARGGRGGYDADMGLAALGYDAPISDNARIGVAGGFSSGQSRATGVKTDVKSWFIGPYGTLRVGPVTLDADAAYTYSHGSMKGSYSFPYVDSTTGDFDANTLSANLKASHTFGFADNAIRLTPSVGVEFAYSARDAFTESGSSITRRYAAGETTSVGVPIGAALQRDFIIGHTTVTPELSAYYVREVADTAPTARVTLLDSTVSSTTKGADAGPDLWRTGFGVHADLGDGFNASANYTGEFGDRYSNNGAELLLQYAF